MGQFSWITSDQEDRIINGERKDVYLLTPSAEAFFAANPDQPKDSPFAPNGEKIWETQYEGYGVFDGRDAYALLGRWNAPEQCDGTVENDRIVGIHLNSEKLSLKFVRDRNLDYDEVGESDTDPDQGFPVWEDDEEMDDEDWANELSED